MRRACCAPCGIIPALAGNTSRQPAASNTIGDHPRACGEHVTVPQDAILTAGSSPRLRGTPSASRRSPTVRGSSPRLRGTQRHYTLDYSKVTIIPALAGNTEARTVLDTVQTVSSPRLRGTHTGPAVSGRRRGIIPALAGNTRRRSCLWHATWDHPRACGEHSTVAFCASMTTGSSPRLRGTHGSDVHPVVRAGIIPALAGNTQQTNRPLSGNRDHPRACGEHLTSPQQVCGSEGSSPRLRGTRCSPIV